MRYFYARKQSDVRSLSDMIMICYDLRTSEIHFVVIFRGVKIDVLILGHHGSFLVVNFGNQFSRQFFFFKIESTVHIVNYFIPNGSEFSTVMEHAFVCNIQAMNLPSQKIFGINMW